jgi:O-antigen/teichoic acid export membrane protein
MYTKTNPCSIQEVFLWINLMKNTRLQPFESRAALYGSIATYISKFTSVAISLITAPLLIKYLSQEDYGSLNLINSINSIFTYITSFGLASIFSRYIPEFLEKHYITALLKITVGGVLIRILSLVVFLSCFYLLSEFFFLFFSFTPFLREYFILIIILILLSKLDETLGPMLLGAYLEQVTLSIIGSLQQVLRLIVILYSFYTDGGLLIILYGLILIEAAIVFLYSFMSFYRTKQKIRSITGPDNFPFPVTRIFKFGLFSFALSSAGVFFELSIDNLVISHYLGISSVATYAFAYTILNLAASLNPIAMLKTQIGYLLVRHYVREKNDNILRFVYRLSTSFSLMFMVPLLSFLAFYVDDLIPLLNKDYQSTSVIIFVLMPRVLALALQYGYAYILNALERADYRFYAVFFSIYNFIADIILIQYYGVCGVAFASSSAAVLTTIYFHCITTRMIHLPTFSYKYSLIRVIMNTVLSLMISSLPQIFFNAGILLSSLLFLLSYSYMVVKIKPLHPDDYSFIRGIIFAGAFRNAS